MDGRALKQIHQMQYGEVLALDDSGLLWFGKLQPLKESDDRVIEWQPLMGPPDGVHYTQAKLSFWDDMEKRARELAKDNADDGGEAVSLETDAQADTRSTGESVQDTSDDGVEDGEGKDSSH